MSERRFQIAFSVVLLLATIWYGFQMASYPANAGRVPLIVALVTGGVIVLQILGQARAVRDPDATAEPAPRSAVAAALPDDDPLVGAAERVDEVENSLSGYDTLLRLDRFQRRRLLGIVAFSLLFYVGAVMVGFVLTTGLLITVFLLTARERAVTALAAGAVSAAAVYLLVVVVIGLPPLDGYLF